VEFIVDIANLVEKFCLLRDDIMRVVGQFSDRRATALRGNALGARLAFLNLLLEILQEALEELGFSVGLNRSLVICAAEFSFIVSTNHITNGLAENLQRPFESAVCKLYTLFYKESSSRPENQLHDCVHRCRSLGATSALAVCDVIEDMLQQSAHR
jgi:hypothetical protein